MSFDPPMHREVAPILCSALEEEHGDLARIEHVKCEFVHPGHIEGEALAHDAVPRGTELAIHRVLGCLASDLSRKGGLTKLSSAAYLEVDAITVCAGFIDCCGHELRRLIQNFRLHITILHATP